MLITKQILVSTLVLGACVLNLAGCGQTGALYLPARTTPTKPTPVPPIPSSEPTQP